MYVYYYNFHLLYNLLLDMWFGFFSLSFFIKSNQIKVTCSPSESQNMHNSNGVVVGHQFCNIDMVDNGVLEILLHKQNEENDVS